MIDSLRKNWINLHRVQKSGTVADQLCNAARQSLRDAFEVGENERRGRTRPIVIKRTLDKGRKVVGNGSLGTVAHVTTIPMSLTFLRGQVGYMKSRGLAVHAISSPGEELWSFAVEEQIPVYAVEMTRRITPLRDLRALWRLRKVLSEIRPTIVHSHTPKGGLLGMLAAMLERVPIRVYHMRGLPFVTATGIKRRVLVSSEKLACALAHRVLCNSHSMRGIAIEEGLCPAEKIEVLRSGSGNGVDATGRFDPDRVPAGAGREVREELGIPLDSEVVGFLGRLVREKGIVELEEAWRRLRSDHMEAHLLLIGPFETQDPLPGRAIERLQEDPRVHLMGLDWDTPRLYAAMDLVVLPTYREGFPNVPLEAAAMRLPVVATRIPGCVDAVVDGVTGTLVPVRDAVALEHAIRTYLEDPVLRRRHGEAGRERVLEEFRPEAIWAAVHEEYAQLLKTGVTDSQRSPAAL